LTTRGDVIKRKKTFRRGGRSGGGKTSGVKEEATRKENRICREYFPSREVRKGKNFEREGLIGGNLEGK